MINQFSKVIPRDKSESYFKHQYFTFKKIISIDDQVGGIRLTITPAYDDEVIFSIVVTDLNYCYELHDDVTECLNEWIENNTSEHEKIFVMLKEM